MAAAVSYPLSASHLWAKQDVKEKVIPNELYSPLAWTRDEIDSKTSHWIVKLEQSEIKGVEKALAGFEELDLDISEISRETFVLPPSLAWRIKAISHQCYQGIGFAIVHGLDPNKYTPKQNIIIFAGMASYVGPQRGYLDRSSEKAACTTTFHSDGAEIISYFAMDIPPEGGRTFVTSSFQLYNELATHPNLTDVQFMASANAVPLPIQRGDIVFMNDQALLHSQEPVDETQGQLIKLYLRDPGQEWEVPDVMRESWMGIYGADAAKKMRNENWGVYF